MSPQFSLPARLLPPKIVLILAILLPGISFIFRNSGILTSNKSQIIVGSLFQAKLGSDAKIFRDSIEHAVWENTQFLYLMNPASKRLIHAREAAHFPIVADYDEVSTLTAPETHEMVYIGSRDGQVSISLANFLKSVPLKSAFMGKLSGSEIITNIDHLDIPDPDIKRLKDFYLANSQIKAFSNIYLDRMRTKIDHLPLIGFLGSAFSVMPMYDHSLKKLSTEVIPLPDNVLKDLKDEFDSAAVMFRKTAEVKSNWPVRDAPAYALLLAGNARLMATILDTDSSGHAGLYETQALYKKAAKQIRNRTKNRDLTLAVNVNLATVNIIAGYLDFDRKLMKNNITVLRRLKKKLGKNSEISKIIGRNLSLL